MQDQRRRRRKDRRWRHGSVPWRRGTGTGGKARYGKASPTPRLFYRSDALATP